MPTASLGITTQKICTYLHSDEWLSTNATTQYLVQLLAGSIVATIGFSTNSETTVIGSMLISPIGALIIDIGKGRWKSKKHLSGRLAATVLVPFLIGMIGGVSTPENPDHDESVFKGRGEGMIGNPRLWLAGAGVAAAAGMLFSWASDATPGIGIGIATALLPPITAAGYGIGRYLRQNKRRRLKGTETAQGVGFSFANFGINFVILLISVWSVQMLKQKIYKGCSNGGFSISNSATAEISSVNI